jgi:hydrogen cyanide synthase HcnB
MIARDVVIVGAGPAGMAAAIAMGEAGLRPTIIDENPTIGGQIFRQKPKAFRHGPDASSSPAAQRGAALRQRFEQLHDQFELMTDTTVWGIFKHNQIAIIRGGSWQIIEAQQLVLAPGAYEYVCPFPGWTLPGVMTPGAAQSMVKTMKVRPGRRVLVAGSGPFLLVVANQLHAAGVEVAGVVEAVQPLGALRHAAGLLVEPGLLREGVNYRRSLKRAGVPVEWGHVVVRADGDQELTTVTIAPCDRRWRADHDRRRTLEVDTLCVGYGFVPRTDLAQLAGCELQWSGTLGGWVPQVDEQFETSVAGVWAAGDGGGVAGAAVAALEGSIVGLAVARRLERLGVREFENLRAPLVGRLTRSGRFRAALDRIYRIGEGLGELAEPDTIVCRCEELTCKQVDTGIDSGGTDIRSLKVMTRLGMGPCQGRMCWPATARMIACRTGKPMEKIGPRSVRPPIAPLAIQNLLGELPVSLQATLGGDAKEWGDTPT